MAESSAPVSGSNSTGDASGVAPAKQSNVPVGLEEAKPAGKPAVAKPDPREALTKKAPAPSEVNPAEAQEKAKQEAAAEERRKLKLKLKVDGKEEEVEYDEEGLKRELQMSRAAQKRMQEAAQLKKDVAALVQSIKENPMEALKSELFGVDVKEMVRQQLIREYEESLAPPEDREKMELRRKAEEYERKVKEFEERQRQEEQARFDEQVRVDIRNTLKTALETSGLPQTRETLYEIAQVMKINLAKGLDLTPEQLASETVRRLEGHTGHYLKALDGEALVKRLGDDVVKKVVKYMVEKTRSQAQAAAPTPPPEPVVAPTREGEEPKKKRMSPEEKAKWYRDLLKG